jgi:hypothetical protein
MVSAKSVVIRTMLVLLGATSTFALPKNFPRVAVSQDHYEVLGMRASTEVKPAAVLEVQCLNAKR